eukprot:30586-Rhodomonas_salina.1
MSAHPRASQLVFGRKCSLRHLDWGVPAVRNGHRIGRIKRGTRRSSSRACSRTRSGPGSTEVSKGSRDVDALRPGIA